jgi:hypothetical protein
MNSEVNESRQFAIDIPNLITNKSYRWNDTQKIIKELYSHLDGEIVLFYFGSGSSFTESSISNVYLHLSKLLPCNTLNLIIYGPGGSGNAAYRLIKLIRNKVKFLRIFAPENASSAMTILALGGDEIVFTPLTMFSPIDSSIIHPLGPVDSSNESVAVEIMEVRKYLELVESDNYSDCKNFSRTPYATLSEKVHPIFLGAIQRALSLSKLLLKKTLETHLTDITKIENIVTKLNDDFPTHSFPITPEDLISWGVNCKEMSPELQKQFFNLTQICKDVTNSASDNDGEKRKTFRSSQLFESNGFRTTYYWSQTKKLIDGKWIEYDYYSSYHHHVVLYNKRGGYYQVGTPSAKDFQRWLDGEEIETND